uniref:PHD-type domain-containing protein n=1 Tax=Globodera rostochiensis TaxID=31243 RepID=A0A914HJN6_GLORO
MHSSCIDMPLNMVEVIRKYEWLCIECKRCSVCEQPDQEAAMMCCDACDRGYHTFCIGLEMPPNGTWHCPECKAMDEQLRKRYLSVLTVKESKPGEWRQGMPYLDLKSSTREAFVERNFEKPQKRKRGRPINGMEKSEEIREFVLLSVYFQLCPMSSISSGVDLTVKYQRLAVEFVKVRNQVSVLKTALLAEQSKSADLGKELALKETGLFRLENERDSLLFRNDQLLKRVESLQEGMDAQQATFGMAKGKKKHKEANLRLVAESSRMHQQALSGATASDPLSVLEGELERKIAENGELHSKLFDVERRFDDTVTAYIRRIDDLEKENEALKDANSPSSIAKQNFDSNGQSPLTETNDLAADGLLCSSHNLMAVSVVPQSPGDRTIGGKPSDSGLSSSFGDRTEPESFEHNDNSGDTPLSEKYSVERMSALGKSLHHATGRATYYKQECEELLRKAISDQTHIGTLESHNSELATKCRLLNDSLETTQINYEARFRELHEHLVEQQQSKITAQTDRTLLFNCGEAANHQQKSGERSVENGERAKKNEKAPRSNWFSSSTSSK